MGSVRDSGKSGGGGGGGGRRAGGNGKQDVKKKGGKCYNLCCDVSWERMHAISQVLSVYSQFLCDLWPVCMCVQTKWGGGGCETGRVEEEGQVRHLFFFPSLSLYQISHFYACIQRWGGGWGCEWRGVGGQIRQLLLLFFILNITLLHTLLSA